ncbi:MULTISPECIES: dihydroneopterin triphosphate diphosphatase [Niveibacterium]|uniref:Dihydroneopterin triphosphate diphosphatase n=1 Tax=Niveibacterium microcysteis TaxID=2811415 RepID=A0ABX7MBU8_9RHOO|nr:dihydroneopterin triphosphate diphosphatase [Niveibacterium microcysteis]QSI78163.1 dihydroneopterin triphosphate diphosphatase [Niveibacterium microcysteis]
MTYKKPVSVLVVIHSPAQEILLIERAAHPGYWQSVTGSQEDDEPLLVTAAREVFEETGIRAAAGALTDWHLSQQYEIFPQWRHRYAPGVTHNTEHVFSLCVPRGTPITLAPDEHRAWRWLPLREAAEACFSWSNRDAILALPQRIAAASGSA